MIDLSARDLAATALACLAAFLGTTAVRALARRLGIMSAPNPLIPQHTRTVAYLGGVGVAVGMLVGLATLVALGGEIPAHAMAPALLFLVLGVIDDLVILRPSVKLVAQASLAALAVALGVRARLTGLEAVDPLVSWLWIVTLVNAFNVTDVCDGLLGSLGVVAFTALAWFDPGQAGVALVLAGACLGFLGLNLPPASIFLGDAGSHLLGFLAAALTLGAIERSSMHPILSVAACLLLVGVPLFEMIFLIAVRVGKGRAWWRGSPDHFSLRLQVAGLTRGGAVIVACSVAAAWAGAALVLPSLSAPLGALLVAAVLLSAAGAATFLRRHEVAAPVAMIPAAAEDLTHSIPSGGARPIERSASERRPAT